jgi:hypothetical protein
MKRAGNRRFRYASGSCCEHPFACRQAGSSLEPEECLRVVGIGWATHGALSRAPMSRALLSQALRLKPSCLKPCLEPGFKPCHAPRRGMLSRSARRGATLVRTGVARSHGVERRNKCACNVTVFGWCPSSFDTGVLGARQTRRCRAPLSCGAGGPHLHPRGARDRRARRPPARLAVSFGLSTSRPWPGHTNRTNQLDCQVDPCSAGSQDQRAWASSHGLASSNSKTA